MFLKFCNSYYGLDAIKNQSQVISEKKQLFAIIFTFWIKSLDSYLYEFSSHIYSQQFHAVGNPYNVIIT